MFDWSLVALPQSNVESVNGTSVQQHVNHEGEKVDHGEGFEHYDCLESFSLIDGFCDVVSQGLVVKFAKNERSIVHSWAICQVGSHIVEAQEGVHFVSKALEYVSSCLPPENEQAKNELQYDAAQDLGPVDSSLVV